MVFDFFCARSTTVKMCGKIYADRFRNFVEAENFLQSRFLILHFPITSISDQLAFQK